MTSRFSSAAVRELMAAIAQRDWSPAAERHFYGFVYDAAHDVVSITSNAPEAERSLVMDRFGDRVQIRYGDGRRR